jgi:hypothetical protein
MAIVARMQTPLDPTRTGEAPAIHVRVTHGVRADLDAIASRRGLALSGAVRLAMAEFIERHRHERKAVSAR